MRRLFPLFLMLFVVSIVATAQQRKFNVYAVGFYNLENLFDTCHDTGKNDYEFLANGSYKWNGIKYSNKLANMSRVLAEMGTDVLPSSVGCALIGVSEVENARALSDLIAQPALAARGYQFCHIEGPDRRGVDCALSAQTLRGEECSSPSLCAGIGERLCLQDPRVPYCQRHPRRRVGDSHRQPPSQ